MKVRTLDYIIVKNLTMALLSIDSGKVEKLICNYPLIYQKQKNLVNFKFSLFDTYEKKISLFL